MAKIEPILAADDYFLEVRRSYTSPADNEANNAFENPQGSSGKMPANFLEPSPVEPLWRLIEGEPRPDELANARSRHRTSEKHLHLEHHRLA